MANLGLGLLSCYILPRMVSSRPTGSTVAAIIPTRDRLAWTERAVASVLDQTRPPDEVVVIDDGSTDGSTERLSAVFPEIDVIRVEESRGVSAARNRGIRETQSEWLAFLDSDDEWLPEKLEAQLSALAEEPGQLLCHCDEIWIRNGRRVNPRRRHQKRGGHIFRHCLPLCAISPSSAIVHRSLFERIGVFDESLPACEDYDLWLRICARHPVLFIDRQLVRKHGGHDDQLSRMPALDRYRIRALEKILDSGELTGDDRRAAIVTLERKIEVYAAGARKRGRIEEAAALERLRRRFETPEAAPGRGALEAAG